MTICEISGVEIDERKNKEFETWFNEFVKLNSITDRGANGVEWAAKEAFEAGHKLAWHEYRSSWQDAVREAYERGAKDKEYTLKDKWPNCHFLYNLWNTVDILRYENYPQYTELLSIYYKKLFGDTLGEYREKADEIEKRKGYPDTNFISSDKVKELVELRAKHAALLEANNVFIKFIKRISEIDDMEYSIGGVKLKYLTEDYTPESLQDVIYKAKLTLRKYGEVK